MFSAPIVYQTFKQEEQEKEQDRLLILFLFVDTLLSMIPRKKKGAPGPAGNLTDTELVTLALWRFHMKFKDWKHAYFCFLLHYSGEFPKLPSYKNFITGINRVAVKAIWVLGMLMYMARKDNTLLKFLDSSALPVCKNKRISSHKVMRQFATRSHTSQGWFYGMKLHVVIDTVGNLLNVRITTGTVDDRIPVVSMLKDILGIFVADAGYVSRPLKYKLFQMGKDFVTGVRNTMKQIMTKDQHALLKKRQWVEIVFSLIKDRLGIATSLPRSVTGMLAHYIYTLLAYQTFKVLSFKAINS